MNFNTHDLQVYFSCLYARRQDLRIENMAFLSSGWESDIYALDVCWTDASGPQRDALVLRVYGEGETERALREFDALHALRRTGYPVPRTDHAEVTDLLENRPFLIQQRIVGRPLWPLMFQGSAEQKQANITLFCGLLARLHTLDWRVFTPTPDAICAEELIDRMFMEWEPYIATAQHTGFGRVWEWLLQHKPAVQTMPPAVLHMDFHPNNILVDTDGAAYVIDWTGLTISDPRLDIAWTIMLMVPHEGEAWRTTLLEQYQRMRGVTLPDMEFFEVAAALRRLFSVYFSLTHGAEGLGMRAGAVEQMRKQFISHCHVADMLYEHTHLRIKEFDDLVNHLSGG